MKVVVQRVLNSSVVIDDKYEEKINKGLMILLGMTYNDGIEDIDYLINKSRFISVMSDKRQSFSRYFTIYGTVARYYL